MILIVGATHAELGAVDTLPAYTHVPVPSSIDVRIVQGPGGLVIAGVCVGVGKVHASIHTCRAIQVLQPKIVACIGTCGALDPELEIGDLLLASRVVQYDVNLQRFGLRPGELPSCGPMVRGFLDTGLSKGDALQIPGLLTGKTLGTADRFLVAGWQSVLPWVKELGVDAVDMESYAVVAAALLYQIPNCVVRVVSDAPGKRLPARFGNFLRDASAQMLDVVATVCLANGSNISQ